ncbi:Mor transcription activator family protein [Marinobacter shengliensis]|uniref:Mor transcription activator family protein n=1 Tax=Marinobacter shengliensis TaxID=1389223 RepID=UPI002572C100|nr:Mor transcription activator family protein [Marinobacter shengliensis]BEH14296.1 DNA-binding protein [Marinobacter shengliensis]
MSRMKALRHELLRDLSAQTDSLLRDYGIPVDVADQVGHALADHMAQHWGGQLVNFPKDARFEVAQRDLDIWSEFNGRNHPYLAQKYNLSQRAIYDIVRRMKRQAMEDQKDLFDPDED